MKELRRRWAAESPIFWKKVKKTAIQIGSACGTALIARNVWGINYHPIVITVLSYTIAVCSAIAGTAQFTTNSPETTNENDAV